jgi:gliding motility-associated-like protein
LKAFAFYISFFLFTGTVVAQVCQTDSNYYSIRYTTPNNSYITNGIISSQNELVALCQNTSVNSSFVAKFTSQGNVIWANEFIPDYPYVNWLQFPWYTNTRMTGILPSSDSTYYVYGSSFEHGKTVNNVDDPPTHEVGLLLNIDKFGKLIAGRYFGMWRTDYSVNSITQIADGGLVVFLRSRFSPFKSKVICLNKAGDIVWAKTLQPGLLYSEAGKINPLMKQLSNGNLVIAYHMTRSIDDTLEIPFTPTILLLAPLSFFNILIINPKDGEVINHASYECPSLTNTNVDKNFIPEIKSITELPGGNISFCADMYWPIDNVIFYKHKVFSKRAINFITNGFGLYTGMLSYAPENGSCTLQSVWQTGTGDQVLLAKDSASNQLILFGIDNTGQVMWTKGYTNPLPANNSNGFVLQKQNSNGFSIFQTDPSTRNFSLLITNSIGNSKCSDILPVKIVAEKQGWQWFVDKVQYFPNGPDIDFRYAGFNMVQQQVSISQDTYCEYQFACCKDIIDSLHPHNVSICEEQSYTLPDSTIITAAGSYYQTLRSRDGCDSVIFYNLEITKSPSHLIAPPDTCLDNASTIKLIATGGYETYLWNNISTSDSAYSVSQPGTYTVRVDNLCGSKTDTVQVYAKCDFPVYFPTAFTPNGDYLNDILRVPWANNNKLVRLRIFNRYGQLVYSTTRAGEGWDGNFKQEPQPEGAYTYILEMQGLSGKKIDQKGTVVLLR